MDTSRNSVLPYKLMSQHRLATSTSQNLPREGKCREKTKSIMTSSLSAYSQNCMIPSSQQNAKLLTKENLDNLCYFPNAQMKSCWWEKKSEIVENSKQWNVDGKKLQQSSNNP